MCGPLLKGLLLHTYELRSDKKRVNFSLDFRDMPLILNVRAKDVVSCCMPLYATCGSLSSNNLTLYHIFPMVFDKNIFTVILVNVSFYV